jgi:GNAT superfamily N-acetyltransferase
MFSHPLIRKAIDANKLANFTKEKFVHPTRPIDSGRYIHLRHKPTVFQRDPNWHATVLSFIPGHVDFGFSPADIRLAKTFAPAPHNFTALMASLGLSDTLTMGHAPDTGPSSLQRTYKTMGSMGVEYHNIEYKAQPWYVEYNAMKGKDIKSSDLGNLRPAHLAILANIAEDQLRRNYSLGGTAKPPPENLWTADEFIRFFKENVFPQGAENCIDFIARCLVALARYEAPDSPALNTFMYQLGFARQPEDLVELAIAYFKPGADGFLSFVPPPPKKEEPAAPAHEPSQEEEAYAEMFESAEARIAKESKDKLDAFRKSANYAPFAKAFAGKPEVFDAIAVALHNDNSIFDKIFSSPDDLAWGTAFFKGLGERLAVCEAHQGVAAVLYHKDTYYPGPITHVSAIGFSPAGKVSISHHETIPIGDKPAMVDGLAIGTLGIPSCSYNTIDQHNRLQNRTGDKVLKWAELPIVKSYTTSGPPTVMFTLLDSFSGFEDFNHMVAAQGQKALGAQWLYGVDPNQTLATLSAAVKTGKVHLTPLQVALLRADRSLAAHPKLPPPGAKGDFSWGVYTNNCARLTLLALLAGRALVLRGVRYTEDMDLADVADILLRAGLMPNTDPLVVNRMRTVGYFYNAEKKRIERHPASFLVLGQLNGWSNAAPDTPGVYPPDVPRPPAKDLAAEGKARADGLARLDKVFQKNWQTFIGALPKKPAPAPTPWVVRELTAKDTALIDAHVAGLSDDDRLLRFGVAGAEDARKRVTQFGQPYGVFDAKGEHMVALGVAGFPVAAGDQPAVEVGVSVLPAYRKKGVSRVAMQWALCMARNRGVRLLRAAYRTRNEGSRRLLDSLGKPVQIGQDDDLVKIEMALPEVDGESQIFEAHHRELSAAWPQK